MTGGSPTGAPARARDHRGRDAARGLRRGLAYLLEGAGFLVYCLDFLAAHVRAYGGRSRALAWRYLVGRETAGQNRRPGPAEIVGIASATAASLLGGLITFAPAALYPHYTMVTGTTAALADQQRGGSGRSPYVK